MRFAKTHKAVSYLMVSTAVVMLMLTGELPVWECMLVSVGIVASYFFDPQTRVFMQRDAYGYSLYGTLGLVTSFLLYRAAQDDAWWEGGLHLLLLFLVAKLWHRRHNGDYLQAYVCSFVVLLAATLVEISLFYALFLFLYVVFAMWTLTLFHLRREMEENYLLKHLPGRHGQAAESERVEVERILNSRRVVGWSFLLVTTASGLGTFLLAWLLFVLLPRVQASVDLPFHRRALPTMGFSEHLELGHYGLLRDNPRKVMQVEVLSSPRPAEMRLRGVTFAHYENKQWSQLPGNERPVALRDKRASLLPGEFFPATETPWVEIYLEPLEADSLFLPTPNPRPASSVLFAESSATAAIELFQRPDGQFLVRGPRGRLHYSVFFDQAATVSSAPKTAPRAYLSLPPNLQQRLRGLADSVVQGAQTPREKAERLRGHLHKHYRYTTRLWKPTQPEPILEFLEHQKQGHCEYFATAMALLLRSVDIPSRTVNGYLSTEWNPKGFFVVRQQHAHSWVEAFFDGQWVVLDPTPPQTSPRFLPVLHSMRQFFDGLEMDFGKYVLEYDTFAQQKLGDRFSTLWKPSKTTAKENTDFGMARALMWVAVLFGVLLCAGVVWLFLRRRRRKLPRVVQQLSSDGNVALKRTMALLRKRGFERGPYETLQMLADRLAEQSDASAPLFAKLVEHFYAHRFGDVPLDHIEVERLISALKDLPKRLSM
ncbi:MAG TPA: DUF3488 and transglutaminase-like domain-containing protein [Pseudomonadota bacterium]|nr:DUF3488 and transglutaminase-like domain-containing protein [Pseudomonadota bacterium]